MKNLFIILSIISLSITTQAQINELGVVFGGTNAISDIGSTHYINPNKLGLGFQYRWNRSPRHSWRLNYSNITIAGSDKNSDMPMRKTRNYDFSNNLHEFSAGLEFNFFEFDLHNDWFSFTPYVYLGIATFSYKDSAFYENIQKKSDENKYNAAIPFAVGLKTQIQKRLVLSSEIGARYTFTDNLDGSSPNLKELSFGNPMSNDWYVFTKIALTYTFGKNPCYCTPINF